VNGYDHEASTECRISVRELEHEFDVIDASVSDWLYENAAYVDCMARQGLAAFNRWTLTRAKRKKPANDNGRSS
jgi:hypothetical protein